MKKVLSAVVILLWALACFQIIQGKAMAEEDKIIEVFHSIGTEQKNSSVEYFGTCVDRNLSVKEIEDLLREIANGLGITDGINITQEEADGRHEFRLQKKARHAETLIRFVRDETKQEEGISEEGPYILAEISMDGTTMENAMAMKGKLEETLDEYTQTSRSSANVTGCYDGALTLEQRNEKADEILGQLGAKVVAENRRLDLYTIYAYSTYLSDYVLQENNAVNVNIAMKYNKTEDKTYVYAAVPILGMDY